MNIPGALVLDNSGVNGPGGIITFTPAPLYPSGAQISINLNGVTDFAGNPAPSVDQNFTTAGTADTTPPTVLSVTPAAGSANMGVNTTVTLVFSKSLNPNTVTNSTLGLFSGDTAISGVSIGTSLDLTTVNLTAMLPYNATITVVATHGVTDLAGNTLTDFSSNFATAPAASAGPSVVSMRPAAGATQVPVSAGVTLFLSEPLDPSTIDGSLYVSQNGVVLPGTIVPLSNAQVIEFTPSAAFSPGATVQVFFTSSATDNSGNPLANYQAQFTTSPDLTNVAPAIVATVPGTNTAALPQSNPVIEIEFSKPINAATVTSANFVLEDVVQSALQTYPPPLP